MNEATTSASVAEVLQPTWQLRWVTRSAPIVMVSLDGQTQMLFGSSAVEVLQQAFASTTGRTEWRDIPHGKE